MASGDVNKVYRRFGERAQFLLVYVREAHPADGWRMGGWDNGVKDPRSLAERRKVAGRCVTELKLGFPTLIDQMDDRVAVRWAAWPERLFVVDRKGKVVYAGGQGPWGFWPTDSVARRAGRRRRSNGPSLESFLARFLAEKKPEKGKKTEFYD